MIRHPHRTSVTPGFRGRPARSVARALALAATLLAACGAGAQPTDAQTFKDWSARCETPEGASAEQCFIFQNLFLKEGGQRLLSIAVGYVGAEQQPAAIVTVPLGVSLPQGLGLRVGDGEPVRFIYGRCIQTGCVGALRLTDGLLEQLRGGRQARVSFHDNTGREISIPVSLLGFTAGFKSLR